MEYYDWKNALMDGGGFVTGIVLTQSLETDITGQRGRQQTMDGFG